MLLHMGSPSQHLASSQPLLGSRGQAWQRWQGPLCSPSQGNHKALGADPGREAEIATGGEREHAGVPLPVSEAQVLGVSAAVWR